ncbi:MAG: UDP-N-acetylmuramoyl-L-alanyl-D-glutamate--2,6-diaminopimelate ligase [Pseudomonadota bacterium]
MSMPVNRATRLADLLAGYTLDSQLPEIEIRSVSTSSASIQPGSLFIALQGLKTHGIDHAADAVKAGACVVIFDANDDYGLHRLPLLQKQVDCHWIPVKNLEAAQGHIVSRFYGNPGQCMTMIGVTGTDGKSSVTHLLIQALARMGKTSGSIGTLGYGINNQLTPDYLTTPDVVSLQSRLAEFVEQKCELVVMEVSSHALQQHRTNGCDFNLALLTNLGRDHLDYHGDMAAYAAAKSRLFQEFDLSARILNLDDDLGRDLALQDSPSELITYSMDPASKADVKLLQCDIDESGHHMVIETSLGEIALDSRLIGEFNIANILACIASLQALGFDFDSLQSAVSDLKPIPGRMERFAAGVDQPAALVDFAHTEQALRACLNASRRHVEGEIWCVFGCGGDRDPGKRSGMGRAAETLAEHAIVTDDNPRHESPERIVRDILSGMDNPQSATVIHDRRAAIIHAITSAAPGDLVVIAGKGHEQDQIVGDERRPFNDRDVVRQIFEGVS